MSNIIGTQMTCYNLPVSESELYQIKQFLSFKMDNIKKFLEIKNETEFSTHTINDSGIDVMTIKLEVEVEHCDFDFLDLCLNLKSKGYYYYRKVTVG